MGETAIMAKLILMIFLKMITYVLSSSGTIFTEPQVCV